MSPAEQLVEHSTWQKKSLLLSLVRWTLHAVVEPPVPDTDLIQRDRSLAEHVEVFQLLQRTTYKFLACSAKVTH